MKQFIIFFVINVFVVITTPREISNSEWNFYKKKYFKNYKNLAEDRHHMEIFYKNKLDIDMHNSLYGKGMFSYLMSLNSYSDLSSPDFVSQMNGYKRSSTQNKTTETPSYFMGLANAVLPKSVDWRTKGAVTSVKTQGHCGACWAFSTTGALEGQQFRATGHLVPLSEQNLIDCSNSAGRDKCRGRSRHAAFEYVKQNRGIDTEKSYPYKAAGGSCKYNKRNTGASVKGLIDIPEGNEMKLQEAIASIGPISVSIDASHESFQHYSSGIYYESKCSNNRDDLDHAVLVVGFGTDDRGEQYYIVKNSWGTEWGERGYMKLARNKKNHCGIATSAIYPLV